jgi:uncharacterized protein YegP (UPF0339 family)
MLGGWYEQRIGQPTTKDEVTGYWLFVAGLLVGIVGIILFFLTTQRTGARGIAYALVALAPPFLMLGAIIRFPLRKAGTYLGYLGFLASVVAVIWFVSIFPGGWFTATGDTGVIALYGLGVLLIGIAGTIVPLLTEPLRERQAREREAADREEELATAREEAAAREEELDTAHERTRALEDRVDVLQAEIDAYQMSQARFELFEDRAGQFRWRLRHRNGNVIADSGEGYTRKHNAQKGMQSVRRNALGAELLLLEHEELPEPEAEFEPVEEVESQATFEQYTDQGGEHRWRLRHDNGNIIADGGQGYNSRSGVERAIDSVREYVGPAAYLRFDPTGFEVYKDATEEWRWRLVHKNGNILADSGESYTRSNDARRAAARLRDELDALEFEVYEDSAGEFRWRLRGGNNQIVADSGEGYGSRSGAEDAVERIQGHAPEADILEIGRAAFEVYEDDGGEWRWRLRARNGNIVADSGQGYGGRSDAHDAIESVKRNAPNADQEQA